MPEYPAYQKYPEHTLVIDEKRAAVRVRVGDEIIAESTQALILHEGRYPEVLYVPREDLRMQTLSRSDHSTHCPFKGDATYFDFIGAGTPVAQIAWSYEDPFDQMSEIRDHLAFYADRVQIERLSDQD